MRTKTIAGVLENRYIEKVCMPKNKTKNVYKWLSYLTAKQR